MTMSTKTNLAAVAAFLTVLAAPGFAAAQEGFANYAAAQAHASAYRDQQVNQPNVRALTGTFASANKSVHVKRAPTVSQR
jgi:hypothetical protein